MKATFAVVVLMTAAATGALAAPQESGKPTVSPTLNSPAANPNAAIVPVDPNVVAPIDLKTKVTVPMVCTTGITGKKSKDRVIGEKVIGEKSGEVIGEKVIGEKVIGEKSGEVIGEKSGEVIGEKSAGSTEC